MGRKDENPNLDNSLELKEMLQYKEDRIHELKQEIEIVAALE